MSNYIIEKIVLELLRHLCQKLVVRGLSTFASGYKSKNVILTNTKVQREQSRKNIYIFGLKEEIKENKQFSEDLEEKHGRKS